MKNLTKEDIRDIIYEDYLTFKEVSESDWDFTEATIAFEKTLSEKQKKEFKDLLLLNNYAVDDDRLELIEYTLSFIKAIF